MNDNLVFPLVILPLFLLLFIIARLFSTFFHELGHAIPALVFTKGIVTIFLGSYGDVEKSIWLKTSSRIHIYFKLNPLKWRMGVVHFVPTKLSLGKNVFLLLSGSLFSLIIALLALSAVLFFDLNGFLKLLSVVFLISAIFDLRNIFPSKISVKTNDGKILYNDGRQIAQLIKFDKENKQLLLAYKFYAEKNYLAASPIFEKIDLKLLSNDTLDMMFTTFRKNNNCEKAKEIYTQLVESPAERKFSSNNLCNIGVNESQRGYYDVALNYYNQSLELDKDNIYSLSNRGFNFNLMGRFDEGLADFDRVLSINEKFAYAYSNRGYSKIKLGEVESGLEDIDRAIEIDNREPYAYRSLGIYHLEKGSYSEAIDNLRSALDIDPDTHFINEYIKQAQDKLKIGSIPD